MWIIYKILKYAIKTTSPPSTSLSMRKELSSLEYRRSHSTQAAPYTHACWNRLLFAKRQRGIFRLQVGCANTQWTSGVFSPVPPQPNQKWPPAMGIEPWSLDHEPQLLTIEPFLTPPLPPPTDNDNTVLKSIHLEDGLYVFCRNKGILTWSPSYSY